MKDFSPAKPSNLGYAAILALHPNADPDDYELSRFHWCHTYQANQSPIINVILRHRIPITLDEECLLRFCTL